MRKGQKAGLIMGMEAFFLLLTLLLGTVSHAICLEAERPELYASMSRSAVSAFLGSDHPADISAYIGLDEAEQGVVAERLAAFMQGKSEQLPEQLNEREQVHMQDVRTLMGRLNRLSRVMIPISAFLAIALAWFSVKREKNIYRPILIGLLASFLFGILASIFAAIHFDSVFYRLHELLFTNDYGLMDPRRDILIRMMPETLFVTAGVHALKRALVEAAGILVLLSAIFFYMRRLILRWMDKR